MQFGDIPLTLVLGRSHLRHRNGVTTMSSMGHAWANNNNALYEPGEDEEENELIQMFSRRETFPLTIRRRCRQICETFMLRGPSAATQS